MKNGVQPATTVTVLSKCCTIARLCTATFWPWFHNSLDSVDAQREHNEPYHRISSLGSLLPHDPFGLRGIVFIRTSRRRLLLWGILYVLTGHQPDGR
ncbi:hypothetical protein BC835DRAFT_19339 [Cytidiella melzeri]|nr:hypothetical protein BC835DRAFT_19339 [Cytidiella melzeri]